MGILDSLLGSLSGFGRSDLASRTSGAGRAPTGGLLGRQRRMVRQLVTTPFQQGWQFRVEIDGQPSDMDIYIKEVTYGGLSIEYESKQIGSLTINAPVSKSASVVTVTVRDHEDGRVAAFFEKKAKLVVNPDGTVNLPVNYLFKMRLYRLKSNDSEVLEKEWTVSAAEYGEITRDTSAVTEFVTFPMTFQKYKS